MRTSGKILPFNLCVTYYLHTSIAYRRLNKFYFLTYSSISEAQLSRATSQMQRREEFLTLVIQEGGSLLPSLVQTVVPLQLSVR